MTRPGFRRGWSSPVLFAACMVAKCCRWCITISCSLGNCWQTPCSTTLQSVAALLCCETHDWIPRIGLQQRRAFECASARSLKGHASLGTCPAASACPDTIPHAGNAGTPQAQHRWSGRPAPAERSRPVMPPCGPQHCITMVLYGCFWMFLPFVGGLQVTAAHYNFAGLLQDSPPCVANAAPWTCRRLYMCANDHHSR